MSLDYGAFNQAYEVNHGTIGSWNPTAFTVAGWVYADGLANVITALSKKVAATGYGFIFGIHSYSSGNVFVEYYGNGLTRAISDDDAISASTWLFLAAVIDVGAGASAQKCFRGTLSSAPVECTSYVAQGDAAVGASGIGSEPLYSGIDPSGENDDWDGLIGWYAVYDGAFSLSQIQQLYYHTRNRSGIPLRISGKTLKVWCLPGLHGKSSIPDFSGNGYNGTGNANLIVASHVPLGPPFGFDVGMAYVAAAGGLSIPVAMEYYRNRRV